MEEDNAAAEAGDDDGGRREFEAAHAGDTAAVGRLLDSCRDYLAAIAARGLGPDLVSKVGASDLVQEALLGASRDFGRFGGLSRDELLAWLRAILRNRIAVLRRRYRGTGKRQVSREIPAGDPTADGPWSALPAESSTPGTRAARREWAEALRAALARLPDDYRQAIVWHQYDGLTFEAIGCRLGRSDEAARKLWARALIRLAEVLGAGHVP
jgi:RNA polymerase sigma-70 factor (ECF subfamily)